MRPIVRALAALCLLTGLPAQAQDDFNPCDISGGDTPCYIQQGEYRALKPAGPGPFPVLVYLHGSTGQADDIYNSGYMRQSVVDRGYVLLVPRALAVVNYVSGRDTGWSLSAREDHPRDDIGFLRAVLDHAEREFRVDRRRVLLVGQSDGGFLIWEIACKDPGLASAYAVHAGSWGGPWPTGCRAPVKFMQAHGRLDTVVPFEAERSRPNGRIDSANPVEGLELLARTNGCEPFDAAPVVGWQGFQRRQWRDCRDGALDYLVHNGGHSFPSRFVPAALDWFEGFDFEPPKPGQRVVRRVGEPSESRAGRFKSVGGSGRFKSVPQ
ncbi:MAG: hypothetical protein AAF675_22255 [Pseudomonadota bacterium]